MRTSRRWRSPALADQGDGLANISDSRAPRFRAHRCPARKPLGSKRPPNAGGSRLSSCCCCDRRKRPPARCEPMRIMAHHDGRHQPVLSSVLHLVRSQAAALTAISGPMPLGSPMVDCNRCGWRPHSGNAISVSIRELSQTTIRSCSFTPLLEHVMIEVTAGSKYIGVAVLHECAPPETTSRCEPRRRSRRGSRAGRGCAGRTGARRYWPRAAPRPGQATCLGIGKDDRAFQPFAVVGGGRDLVDAGIAEKMLGHSSSRSSSMQRA